MKFFAVLVATTVIGGCSPKNSTFTLYRTSVLAPSSRIHIATFDANESSETYNQENCELVRGLMERQPRVTVRYWCEKGNFRA
jgi:hypothetical protein